MSIIGMPTESIVTVKKFFTCRFLSFSTVGSSTGPSTPQFQLRLSLVPSRLSSPFPFFFFFFFFERVKKLNQEERIAGCLLMHQLRERGGTLRFAAKRIRNELCYVFNGERRKRDLLHVRSRVPDRFKLAHQHGSQ